MSNPEMGCPTGARDMRCPNCWYFVEPIAEIKNSNPPLELPTRKPKGGIVRLGAWIPPITEGEWWKV